MARPLIEVVEEGSRRRAHFVPGERRVDAVDFNVVKPEIRTSQLPLVEDDPLDVRVDPPDDVLRLIQTNPRWVCRSQFTEEVFVVRESHLRIVQEPHLGPDEYAELHPDELRELYAKWRLCVQIARATEHGHTGSLGFDGCCKRCIRSVYGRLWWLHRRCW